MRFLGYSYTDQTISELIAIDAPTRPLLVLLTLPYSALWLAFGAGIWLSAERSRALRVMAGGLIAKEVLGAVVTIFFPMHLRQVLAAGGSTYSDTLHASLTGVGVLCFLVAIGFGATIYGKRFPSYWPSGS